MEFYRYEKIAPNVTRIADITDVYAYLVEGNDRAVLIDTCCGYGDLRSLIQNLTRLPFSVICTHGHIDHAGGSAVFDEVYLNHKDLDLERRHTTIEYRRQSLQYFLPNVEIPPGSIIPQRQKGYLDLQDGQLFDLGGVTIQALALPGHTPGMTCVLIQELRSVLLGDACNNNTYLFLPEASSVEEYKNNLEHFLRHENKFDRVLFSHGFYSGSKAVIFDCIDLCAEIMAGKTDNIPFEFKGHKAVLAKAVNPDHTRVDGKIGNIVFNPQKITRIINI